MIKNTVWHQISHCSVKHPGNWLSWGKIVLLRLTIVSKHGILICGASNHFHANEWVFSGAFFYNFFQLKSWRVVEDVWRWQTEKKHFTFTFILILYEIFLWGFTRRNNVQIEWFPVKFRKSKSPPNYFY